MKHSKIVNKAFSIAALIGFGALSTSALADQVILDDLIVDGSACVGFDCVNGESFGFDTLRLKENNLRLHFLDTSTSASFPDNDWRIVINDSSNGGAEKFSIEDTSGGRTPFTIEAGAPSHSLFVEDGGRVGFGTSTPVVDLHVKSGNTPTLRLEQDGSSGFGAQTWDVAGNEANFFIRDTTGGSTLPFRIFPGAPTNALTIRGGAPAVDGNIGIGTTTPDANLDIEDPAQPTLLFTGPGATFQAYIKEANDRFEIGVPGNDAAFKIDSSALGNLIRLGVTAPNEVSITGDLVIFGNCTETDGACADHVFEPDYKKLTLPELKTFITKNKHLPKVPSAVEMQSKGVSLYGMSGRLLEKVEELVLYTLEQQETIDELQTRLDKLDSRKPWQ